MSWKVNLNRGPVEGFLLSLIIFINKNFTRHWTKTNWDTEVLDLVWLLWKRNSRRVYRMFHFGSPILNKRSFLVFSLYIFNNNGNNGKYRIVRLIDPGWWWCTWTHVSHILLKRHQSKRTKSNLKDITMHTSTDVNEECHNWSTTYITLAVRVLGGGTIILWVHNPFA